MSAPDAIEEVVEVERRTLLLRLRTWCVIGRDRYLCGAKPDRIEEAMREAQRLTAELRPYL